MYTPQSFMGPTYQPAFGAGTAAQPQAGMRWSAPPEVVTTKDLAYLKDSLSWELLAMKKCHHFAQECSDPQLRQALEEACRMHQRHYETLLAHLRTGSSPSPAPKQPI